jgi:hypothetical protein
MDPAFGGVAPKGHQARGCEWDRWDRDTCGEDHPLGMTMSNAWCMFIFHRVPITCVRKLRVMQGSAMDVGPSLRLRITHFNGTIRVNPPRIRLGIKILFEKRTIHFVRPSSTNLLKIHPPTPPTTDSPSPTVSNLDARQDQYAGTSP